MPMTKEQCGYYKCDVCVASDDFSKKDVYLTKTDGKALCRCKDHGGSGKPFVRPDARDAEVPRVKAAAKSKKG